MIFLKPSEELIHNVMRLVGARTLVDVGAGEGAFEALARTLGYSNILSIDLFPGSTGVLEFNAMEFPFSDRMVPMFIRPCHGHFTLPLFSKLQGTVPFFIYVGLPENMEHDLPLEVANIKFPYPNWKGENGEIINTIKYGKEVQEVQRYYLIENPKFQNMGRWFATKEHDYFVNMLGGRCPCDGLAIVQEFDCAEEDLDYTLTGINVPDSDGGWLSPDGTFYGCRRKDHTDYAVLILKKDPGVLEDEGWVHVYGSYAIHGEGSFAYTEDLTQAQRNWLVAHGHRPSLHGTQQIESGWVV